jgi:hypothetical protein
VSTWPNYEAGYLAKRLGHTKPEFAYANRYWAGWGTDENDDPLIPNEEARAVYLDKITANYKEEADQCLKEEFMQWLQGNHEDNRDPQVFPNRHGQAPRRAIYTTEESGMPVGTGEALKEWKPTWWGKNQLTHLPGVREFLREKKTKAEDHEFAMNVLAEFGPNNIDQAWTYFKHWVKGRPVGPEECVEPHADPELTGVQRSGPVTMATPRHISLYGVGGPSEKREATDVAMDDVADASAEASAAMAAAYNASADADMAVGAAEGPSYASFGGITAEDAAGAELQRFVAEADAVRVAREAVQNYIAKQAKARQKAQEEGNGLSAKDATVYDGDDYRKDRQEYNQAKAKEKRREVVETRRVVPERVGIQPGRLEQAFSAAGDSFGASTARRGKGRMGVNWDPSVSADGTYEGMPRQRRSEAEVTPGKVRPSESQLEELTRDMNRARGFMSRQQKAAERAAYELEAAMAVTPQEDAMGLQQL